MTTDRQNDALSHEERKALGYFPEHDQRWIQTRPLEEQREIVAEAAKLQKRLQADLERKLSELIKRIRERLGGRGSP